MSTSSTADSIGTEACWNEPSAGFEDMDLNHELLSSIQEYGLETPTKLQLDALPLLIRGYDVVVDAPSNSGKTITYCISVLQKVDPSNLQSQVLILVPSSQAASRIQKIILALGNCNIHCHVCTNRAEFREDKMRLNKGSQIVIGTPTYVREIIRQGVLITNNMRAFVFDRVDEMFSEGSKDIIEELFQSIPRSAQVVFLLSKTFMQLSDLTRKFMHSPIFINHDTEEPDLDDSETLSGSGRLTEEKLYEMESKQDPKRAPNKASKQTSKQVPKQDPKQVLKQEEVVDDSESFDNMKLKAELLRGIYASGFKRPSTIQQRAIQPILGNHDVIVQAQSGTDRIAAFTMAILQKLDTSNKQCQALILVPTHDLAQQIQEVIQALGSFMKVQCHICVGGTSIKDDMDRLRRGSQIVVGTLGRVMDMVKRKVFKTDSIRMVVMDEVDEMLSKTLRDQIDHAFEQVLPSTQIVFLSATMPQTALKVASKLLHEPIHIVVKPDELPQGDIKQFYVAVRGDERKLATLCSLCETITASHIVIFCNIHSKVKWLKEKLIAKKLTVSAIHSNMQDIQREAVMEAFSSGSSRVLIMTDFLAYSVDVQHASLVINYDMPPIKENYRRRVSLVGRFGRKGVAISLASDNDVRMLRKIEQLYSMRVAEMSVENPV